MSFGLFQLSCLTEETCRIPKSPTQRQQQQAAMLSGLRQNGHHVAVSPVREPDHPSHNHLHTNDVSGIVSTN